jgi:choline dehydrogenase-like flavoprotein
MTDAHYDAIVIGTGAGGGTLAHHGGDGSVFPSSGAVNPSLTIMANARRVGEHLRARLG